MHVPPWIHGSTKCVPSILAHLEKPAERGTKLCESFGLDRQCLRFHAAQLESGETHYSALSHFMTETRKTTLETKVTLHNPVEKFLLLLVHAWFYS